MNIFKETRRISVIFTLAVAALALAACSASNPMQLAQKNIEEGRLVPAAVVADEGFLNNYDHHLPRPKDRLLDIDIAMERANVLASGDSIYVQVGLSTRAPVLKAKDFHVLAYNPIKVTAKERERMARAIQTVRRYIAKSPSGSSLTIDWLSAPAEQSPSFPSLITHKKEISLEKFLRSYAHLKAGSGRDHFLLLVGKIGNLSSREKQNVVDLANLLKVKHATLSVLSVGEKPEVAFLGKIASNANGLLNVVTKDFDYEDWMRTDASYKSAIKLSNIKLTIVATDNTTLQEASANGGFGSSQKKYETVIPKLVQGEDYVVLKKLILPPSKNKKSSYVLKANVEYFDQSHERYVVRQKTAFVNYVFDRNKTLARHNEQIDRSRLILATARVIKDVVPLIKSKRYYQAVAQLSAQQQKLQKFGEIEKDKELLRDAKILNAYAEQLYTYDEKPFQTIKNWYDLSWDSKRFTRKFE